MIVDQGRLEAAVVEAKGNRQYMEDRHLLTVDEEGALLAAIFDGHNGAAVADLMVTRLEYSIAAEYADPSQFMRASHKQIGLANEGNPYPTGGACALLFWIKDECLELANVGDVELVHVKGHDTHVLTELHRLSNPQERARVLGSGADVGRAASGNEEYVVDRRNQRALMPTRTLGDHEFEHLGIVCKPYQARYQFDEGWLVAACDGLWDVVDADELPQLLDQVANAELAAYRLALAAFDRGSTDNVTVLVVRRKQEGSDLATGAPSPPNLLSSLGDPQILPRDRQAAQSASQRRHLQEQAPS